MTYIVGWKTKNQVFISGDSAITIRARSPFLSLDKKKSSFGEAHFIQSGVKIEESMLKVFNVRNRIGIALTGNIKPAIDCINQFRQSISSIHKTDINKRTILELLKTSFKQHPSPKGLMRFELLIGFHSDGVPYLFTLNQNGSKQLKEHIKSVHLGCILGNSIEIASNTDEIIKADVWENFRPEAMLASVNCFVQKSMFGFETLQKGVGGFFVGIYIDKDGINWQADTTYLLIEYKDSSDHGSCKLTKVVVRDGYVAVSSIDTGKRYFTTSTNEFAPRSWWNKWKETIIDILNQFKSDFYMFDPIKYPTFAVIESGIEDESKYFELHKDMNKPGVGSAIIKTPLLNDLFAYQKNNNKKSKPKGVTLNQVLYLRKKDKTLNLL